MYSTKIAAGAMIAHTTRSSNRIFGSCFSSASTPSPPEGGIECVGDKAKQTMDNVSGAAKDASQKVKDRVTGSGTNTAKPSKDPDQNHGVETTDSSCEDVRGRPGGYN